MSKPATLLFAHGGGFCKEIWEPIMRRLKDSSLLQGAVSTEFVSFDFKYHGSNRDESVPAEIDLSKPGAPRVRHPAADMTVWTSADVLHQVRKLKSRSVDTPLIGIGHSMGASAMWNTEVQYPGTFDGLILFEPVYGDLTSSVADFLVSITLQRESSWPSRAAAEDHLRQFKNFSAWDRESLDAYMKGALVTDASTGKTLLACSPPIEASLYCHKLLNFNAEQLARPQCQISFHSGGRTKMFLPSVFQELSSKWPTIYSISDPVPDSSHAFVMEKPAQVTQKIVDSLHELQLFTAEDEASAARL